MGSGHWNPDAVSLMEHCPSVGLLRPALTRQTCICCEHLLYAGRYSRA